MRDVTNLMINEFKIRDLGMDFIGYKVDRAESLTFHHLIIPKRECKRLGIANLGYTRDNGAILIPTSHQYLHTIEQYDFDTFAALTSEMYDENVSGCLKRENLLAIRELLEEFEEKYRNQCTRKGHRLIREEYYTKRLVPKSYENLR